MSHDVPRPNLHTVTIRHFKSLFKKCTTHWALIDFHLNKFGHVWLVIILPHVNVLVAVGVKHHFEMLTKINRKRCSNTETKLQMLAVTPTTVCQV